jgi:hypothetical protein
VAGGRATRMRTLAALLSWTLLIAAVAAPPSPPGSSSAPQANPAQATDAQERNEERARPTRAADPEGEREPRANRRQRAESDADHEAPPDSNGAADEDAAARKLTLTASQEQAVGIRIDTPLPLTSSPAIDAYATVLDPVVLLSDAGRLESTRALAAAASADAARQESLYRDGTQASLKAVQASRAQAVEANTQAQAALLSFKLQWGPLAALSPVQRDALLGKLGGGGHLLLRADVPGRHFGGALGPEALLEVDGAQIAAHVLGPLPRTDAQAQSAGWLLEVDRAPPGFGPGARTTARLAAATARGLLVPAASLIYAEQGTYVYRQVRAEKHDTFAFEAVPVRPLTRVGPAWLVDGLERADQIVVQGAGVLWSLQGIANFSAAEEEHD